LQLHEMRRVRPVALDAELLDRLLQLLAVLPRHDDFRPDALVPLRDRAADAAGASDHQRDLVVEAEKRVCPRFHFSSSGATRRGRISGMSGQMMIAASMKTMGTSMMSVSLSAYRIGTPATE